MAVNFLSPPPLLLHQSYTPPDTGGSFIASNPMLIIAPAVIALLLVIFIACLLVYCREKPRNDIEISKESLHDSFGSERLSKCGSDVTSSAIYSPDVRSCIYGGKLGFTLQARNRGAQVFTYKELELATDGFSASNVIGNGGFGIVFRGTLNDGTVTAIKKLHRDGKQGEREFRLEVDLLSQLHSPQLVGLLGYCADQHHRLLVFEFMPNGNLQQHLHQIPQYGKVYQPLDWWTRLRIALDCARALEFLHEHSSPSIIHRDFKPSNVLLDHNFRAKVSDFGMAKVGSDKLNGQVLTRVLGTTGYLAPEYASTGKLTTKSDVYSYGMVLLELLTGRVPVDSKRPSGEHVLVSWALPRLTNREKVEEMVDPVLKGQFSKKDLIQVAAIAAVCVQAEADYRPLMTDVVQSLIPLVLKTPGGSLPATPARNYDSF
ncbi:serine/threonine-protein kinase CDL1-like protein [Carex littledalei]|uniref:Serine/threonine-protein kinase CDL1-like protein n=1 Tax=Carex littledalei TaxID=544730 RepID=A0A833R8C8_9POAL|nr:serine/threonine-protein kinase CDL1-like protein [Carex littledalei]